MLTVAFRDFDYYCKYIVNFALLTNLEDRTVAVHSLFFCRLRARMLVESLP